MSVYLGRIVAVACTPEGRPAALYRVSSRSFPNRRAVTTRDGRGVAIVPKAGHEGDVFRNPYIAYNCARLVDDSWAVVSNGSHTDPVAEKLEAGYPPRDALVASLLGMDYEKDDYNTPRIAAIVPNTARIGDHLVGWLGTVRADGLEVRCFKLAPGECVHLSTYEHALVGEEHRRKGFDAKTAEDACAWALGQRGPFAEFSNPVTAVCAVLEGKTFALASVDK